MSRLRAGQSVPHLQKHCISCYSCETFCPNDGHPYLTILDRWRIRYDKEGLPRNILYMLVNGGRNFRTDTRRYMKPEDQALLAKWKENENITAAEEILYPGCNLLSTPSLANIDIFKNLPIAGSFQRCCGEMFFRLGLVDEAARRAKNLGHFYAEKQIKRMIFVCPAGYHMFKDVMPELFGVNFNFEKVFIVDWLFEKIQAGQIKITRPLRGTYSIHDSCHARVMGDDFTAKIRKLIALLGGSIAKNSQSANGNGYCCGIAAAAKSHKVLDIVKVANRALKAGQSNEFTQTVAYCTGCSLTLTMTGLLLPGTPPVSHLLHLVSYASGSTPPPKMKLLAWPAIRAVAQNGVPLLLSPEKGRLK